MYKRSILWKNHFITVSMKNTALVVNGVLRVGIFGEFLGHGVLALQGKEAWIGWIVDLLHVSPEAAAGVLTAVGMVDILVAVVVLIAPMPAVVLWATAWGFWTALVRPIVGEPIMDFVERWANWAAPLALLILLGMPKNFRSWFKIAR